MLTFSLKRVEIELLHFEMRYNFTQIWRSVKDHCEVIDPEKNNNTVHSSTMIDGGHKSCEYAH